MHSIGMPCVLFCRKPICAEVAIPLNISKTVDNQNNKQNKNKATKFHPKINKTKKKRISSRNYISSFKFFHAIIFGECPPPFRHRISFSIKKKQPKQLTKQKKTAPNVF